MRQNAELFKELAEKYPDEVLYPFSEIIKMVGFDGMYKISEVFGGTSIYIPKPRKMFKESMDKQIAAEFDGANYIQLATKYNLCERSIRNIIQGC